MKRNIISMATIGYLGLLGCGQTLPSSIDWSKLGHIDWYPAVQPLRGGLSNIHIHPTARRCSNRYTVRVLFTDSTSIICQLIVTPKRNASGHGITKLQDTTNTISNDVDAFSLEYYDGSVSESNDSNTSIDVKRGNNEYKTYSIRNRFTYTNYFGKHITKTILLIKFI